MLTYIARRVLYSIPVLIVSSFLSFMFVSLAGDPTGNLRQNPRVSQLTLHLLQLRSREARGALRFRLFRR